jgi:acyl-CoA synthetase (AMP-forming)/AMP-acid ligase II
VISFVALARLGACVVPLVHKPMGRFTDHDRARIDEALVTSAAAWLAAPAASAADYATRARLALTESVDGRDGFDGADVPDDAPLLLQFTAGTTAAAKAIELTHGNVASNVAAIARRIAGDADDTLYSWLPLYHDMGLIGGLITSLYQGATLHLVAPQEFLRRPLGWLRAISEHRATFTVAPQFAYRLVLARYDLAPTQLDGCDLSSLRVALNGAEMVQHEVCTRLEERLARHGLRRHTIQPCYGLAENCVAVTVREPQRPIRIRHLRRDALAERRAVSLPDPSAATVSLVGNGAVVDDTEVRLLTDAGASADAIGEIEVRGRSAAHRISDGDGVAHRDGWIATGDLGVFLDGELFVVGRIKEAFKSGGRTFAPADVEEVLRPLTGDRPSGVAAFAFSDPATGVDELVVVIEREPQGPTRAALDEQVRLQLLRTMQLTPRDVVLVRRGTIPLTSSGKIRRLHLRDLYLGGGLEPAVAPGSP